MSGVAFAITAGIGFGLFQAVNRRANTGIDAYRATFGLLAIGTVLLAGWSLLTQDLSLLTSAPLASLAFFGAAGIIHFFLGWTFLALSQQRVGASRTSATVAVAPLIASILAAVVLDEGLTAVIITGVLLAVIGLALLALRSSTASADDGQRFPIFGLAAAISWGTSPLFIRWGLEGLPAPILGVTVGLAAAMAAYALALTVSGRWSAGRLPTSNLWWLAVAGVLVAVAIAAQWISYDLIAIAIAFTIMQLAAPVVIVTAPVIVGTDMERITWRLVAGTALVMSGSILAILAA